jgi:hypothetical protein
MIFFASGEGSIKELIEKRAGICQTERKTDRQTGRMERKWLGREEVDMR